ncbi:MAG: hypothetical protein JRE18_02615 [Deltaproteobacteria bacterium]|jgi:hypothetical protein|nr:hypothetical protein [Deltaproteobacteria bacterium]MBW2484740.1 hypothetical protein [Deltaproteobacteria bacterium]
MPKIYNTIAAVQYLAENGYNTTKGTLEVKRCQRRGPEFIRIENKLFYTKESLDAFLSGKHVKTVDAGA